jgi:hypothetical protein
MTSTDLSALPQRQRDAIRNRAALHLRPILHAVENYGVGLFMAVQAGPQFSLPACDRPLIILLGDDLERALGPDGFEAASLKAVVARAQRAAIVACEPLVEIYGAAAKTAALLRIDVLIVETQPDQEIPWVQYLLRARPGLGLLIGSVVGGRA